MQIFTKSHQNPGRGCPPGSEGCRVRVATVAIASQSVTIRTHACCIGNETTVWSCFDVHMDQEMWSCFDEEGNGGISNTGDQRLGAGPYHPPPPDESSPISMISYFSCLLYCLPPRNLLRLPDASAKQVLKEKT